jgi:hypothetical protein
VLLSEHNFGGFRALSGCIWNLKTADTALSDSDISESIARKNPGAHPKMYSREIRSNEKGRSSAAAL